MSKSTLASALYWYQKKIGSYDQQLWEKTIEERVLKGLSHAIPKKVTRPNHRGYIDLDLIRGSTFTKAKPQQSCFTSAYLGIIRVLLFPFYLRWWRDQTNHIVTAALFALWIAQVAALYVYFNLVEEKNDDDIENHVPLSEILTPLIMFFLLAGVQSQIASSHRQAQRISEPRRVPIEAAATQTLPNNTRLKHKKRHSKQKASPSSNAPTSPQVPDENLLAQPLIKKVSDDESGLDVTMDKSSNITHNRTFSFNNKRRPLRPKNLNMLAAPSVDSDRSEESPKPSPGLRKRTTNLLSPLSVARSSSRTDASGEEGDGETENIDLDGLSSPDDISPYSTVDSNNLPWRRFSEMVGQQGRSASQVIPTRKFSVSDDGGLVRSRSNTLVAAEDCKTERVVRKSRTATFKLRVNTEKVDERGSSCESECSLSPTTPITAGLVGGGAATDLDWPMVNSDGTSEEEDEDDVPTTAAAVEQKTEYFVFSEDIDDPDSLPPQLFMGGEDIGSCGNRPSTDKNSDKDRRHDSSEVSCAIWVQNECQKVDLTVLDISGAVIRKVDRVKHSNEYFYLAVGFSIMLALIPAIFRLQTLANSVVDDGLTSITQNDQLTSNVNASTVNVSQTVPDATLVTPVELLDSFLNAYLPVPTAQLLAEAIMSTSQSHIVRFVVLVAMIERFCLSLFFFFLMCVAERTYKERFLMSKYFCHLTSSRRARRSDLPHFRLNKVRNIKTWLSVRSYLKKHGPQRSVNVIVSSSFILAVVILTFLCMQLLRETGEPCSSNLYCWEMVCWNIALGLFIMRLIILGSKMNRKYKGNLSVLITEQINLYLQLEQKPHKKEELTLANHVLKLAADLLKQLETPFKISGFSANHYLYNITKVVVLSAFSAVLTEMLGFKLKLHKIKL